jgi:ABC-type multidrug transport system permease subunit
MDFSWTAATLFTSGVDQLVDQYTDKYHHKAVMYFSTSVVFIIMVAVFSVFSRETTN